MNTSISFFNSVNSAVCRPLLNYFRITGRQSGRNQISQAFLTLSLSLFNTIRFFLALFLHATLHYPNAWNRLCFRVGRRTIKFPSHFCHHISVLPCFRFFLFFLTHVKDRMINVSEILPLRPIKVNNGKFYLLLRSGYFVNGCVFTRIYVICKICEKLRRIHSCRYLLDLSQSVLQ